MLVLLLFGAMVYAKMTAYIDFPDLFSTTGYN